VNLNQSKINQFKLIKLNFLNFFGHAGRQSVPYILQCKGCDTDVIMFECTCGTVRSEVSALGRKSPTCQKLINKSIYLILGFEELIGSLLSIAPSSRSPTKLRIFISIPIPGDQAGRSEPTVGEENVGEKDRYKGRERWKNGNTSKTHGAHPSR
jgi:hypothetical protein